VGDEAAGNAAGRAKEALGALTCDGAKKAEGRAQQRKAEAQEEAAQFERTNRAKQDARRAERERGRKKERVSSGVSTAA
jgi:uncharacterized protein YjbJ (UPF0337 family)